MFFSLLKSKLQKKQGLYYEDLNNNIKEVIKTIPEAYYNKILNGTTTNDVSASDIYEFT